MAQKNVQVYRAATEQLFAICEVNTRLKKRAKSIKVQAYRAATEQLFAICEVSTRLKKRAKSIKVQACRAATEQSTVYRTAYS
ncbi:hypothetical protein BC936DRAFT_138923 [Jimgerdemannia flammicorona]|uniref:Uncharacterized protein n=1 Tax=Jimgerdemannia flammicorona TaxID=994334 RepID=A0A433DHZ4_9FUNG|nr:hypothetical protein BC936DRAFT_138923 [Jimgerdemannia flammicorona]